MLVDLYVAPADDIEPPTERRQPDVDALTGNIELCAQKHYQIRLCTPSTNKKTRAILRCPGEYYQGHCKSKISPA